MADINIGAIVGQLKIDLTGWTQGLQAAQAQLRALQQQSQQLSGSLSTGAFTSATAAVQAFERAVQGATFAQVAATTMQNANTNAMQGGTQQTNATTASTNQLAAAYLAMAQSIQNQTQAYTQAQAAALAYRQQQDALREATRQAAAEASKAGDIWRQVFAVAGGVGLVTSLQGVVSSISRLITDLVAHMGRFASESLAGFATFESGILKVGTLIEGFQGKGAAFDTMATQVQDWAITSGKSTADITKSLFELVSVFGSVEKASVIMTQALRLAEGGQTTVAIAGKALGTIMEGLHIPLERTAEAANAVAKAAQQNRQDLGSFASSISPLMPALAATRLSLQNAGAAMSVLTTQGYTSGQAVTALNNILINIIAPAQRADKTIKDLAAALGMPRIEAKRLQDGTLDLLATFKQFDVLDPQVLRRVLGGNKEALLALEALIFAHDKLKARMEDANQASDTLSREQALNAASLTQAWNKASEAFKAVRDTIGQFLGQNPAVNKMLSDITTAFLAIREAVKDVNSPLSAMLKTLSEIAGLMGTIVKGTGLLLSGDFAKGQRINQLQVEIAALQEQKGQGTIGRFFNRLGQEAVTGQPAVTVSPADIDRQIAEKTKELVAIGAAMGETAYAARPTPAAAQSAGTGAAVVSPPRPAPTTTMADLTAATDAAKAAKAAAADAEREAERDAAERRRQVFATGGEALRVIDVEVTERERLIESLRRLGAQYGMSKVARDADTASTAAAALATSGYSEEADELNKGIQASTKILETLADRRREAAASAPAGIAALQAVQDQTAFDKKLADQLRVLQVPRDERIAVRMRNQAPGGVTTEDQDRTLAQIAAQERLNHAAQLFSELGTSVGNAWTSALFSIADGTKSVAAAFQQMARSILQSMAQIASQEAFKALIGLGMRAITGGITPNATQYLSPIGPTASGSGFLGAQGGAIVNRPTAILAGENPSMNPEFVLNRPQMQALMASAVRSAPSAGGQAAGRVTIINYTSDQRTKAEQEAARQQSQGKQAILNEILSDMQRGESSQIVRMMRTVQR